MDGTTAELIVAVGLTVRQAAVRQPGSQARQLGSQEQRQLRQEVALSLVSAWLLIEIRCLKAVLGKSFKS